MWSIEAFTPAEGRQPPLTFLQVLSSLQKDLGRALKVLLLQVMLGQITHKCWILLGVSAWEEIYSDGGLHWSCRQRPISLDCAGCIWRVTALRPPTRATKVLIPPRSQLLSLVSQSSFTWPLGQMPLSCPCFSSCQAVDSALHHNCILFPSVIKLAMFLIVMINEAI